MTGPPERLTFVSKDRVRLAGIGPAALIDKWFVAFARATQLFPVETYSRLIEAPADAVPMAARKPVASA